MSFFALATVAPTTNDPANKSSGAVMKMKQRIERVLRLLRLDPIIYYFVLAKDWWRNRKKNLRFRQLNPNVRLPPAALRFDVIGTTDAEGYYTSGVPTARQLEAVIDQHLPDGTVRILEWGCGPGRVITHLSQVDRDKRYNLTGTDYVRSSIEWAKRNYPSIHFLHNHLTPPLPISDGEVDFAYAISVFTHLSEESHHKWLSELLRVLRPGGVLLITTHGDYYASSLTLQADRDRFQAGDFVSVPAAKDGSQMYFALHPTQFMNQFLRDTDILSYTPQGHGGRQDVWVVRKR